MKKYSLLLLIIICVFISGCGNDKSKDVGTLSNFQTVASNNSYTVTDNMNSYQDIDYIIGSMVAAKDDITIEMVLYDTAENATKAQDNQINVFNNYKSAGATTKKEKGTNYYKYVFVSNGYYMVSSRIDNSLIFTKVPLVNKDEVENILSSMDY